MIQIIQSSNATKSNIMIGWWEPEPLPEVFGLTRVKLPRPDAECLQQRVTPDERCSEDFDVRKGSEEGSCDFATFIMQKAIATSLADNYRNEPKAKRNPGYDGVKSMLLSTVAMEYILDAWINRGVDTYGYDPRFAVCDWVADNRETLKSYVPEGYPRSFAEGTFPTSTTWAAFSFTILVCLIVVVCYIVTLKYSHTKAMRYSQTKFLHLTLGGFIVFLIGAALVCFEPSLALCTAAQWFVNVGYTLSLIPLVVKIAAINKVAAYARRMQRVKIDTSHMFAQVVITVGIMVLFLIIWTAMDPPSLKTTYDFDDNNNPNQNHRGVWFRLEYVGVRHSLLAIWIITCCVIFSISK